MNANTSDIPCVLNTFAKAGDSRNLEHIWTQAVRMCPRNLFNTFDLKAEELHELNPICSFTPVTGYIVSCLNGFLGLTCDLPLTYHQ
ncbi:hypothetical protein F2P79_000846 [Pimephales promelas]|nr:hypothetical protein F2P79_000846 [Pimephales promelas]